MDKPCHIQVKLELGHKAEFRKKPTPGGMTHDWCVFVRGPGDQNIHSFIDKVVFHLHESFPKPKRVVKEPPYELKECGYGTFELPIDIYFKNNEEPKKITFTYELFLQLPGHAPINHVRCEKLTFQNPTSDFKKRLLKGGGELLPVNQVSDHSEHSDEEVEEKEIKKPDSGGDSSSSASSSPASSPPHQPTMTQVHSAKPLPLPSAKNPTTRDVPMAAVKPLQQQVIVQTTGTTKTGGTVEMQPFTELFGTPVKIEDVKKSKPSGSSKVSSSKSGKESGKHAKKRSPDSKEDETTAKKHKPSESDNHPVKKEKSEKKSKDKSSKKHHSSSSSSSNHKSHHSHKKSSSHGHSVAPVATKVSPGAKSDLPSFSNEVNAVSDDDSWDESMDTSETFSKRTPNSPFSDKSTSKKSPAPYASHKSPQVSDTKKVGSPNPIKAESKSQSSHNSGKKKEKSKHASPHHPSAKSEKKPLTSVMAELESSDEEDNSTANQEKKPSKHRDTSEKKHEKHKKEHKSSKEKKHSKSKPEQPAKKESPKPVPVETKPSVTESLPEPPQAKSAKAPNGALINDLLDLQQHIMQLKNHDHLKKVASIIASTGQYSVGGSTFDFDLCNLNQETVQKVKSLLKSF